MKFSPRLLIRVVLFTSLLLLLLFSLIKDTEASEFKANFETIPAVDKSPLRVGVWKSAPTIVVCDTAPIENYQILAAASFWTRLGHPIKEIQFKNANEKQCTNSAPVGYIIITLAAIELETPTSLAETRFFVNNSTTAIEWAIIALRSDVRPKILEHEIGHALGYLHCDTTSHLMHSKWPSSGWDTTGLEQKR